MSSDREFRTGKGEVKRCYISATGDIQTGELYCTECEGKFRTGESEITILKPETPL